MRSLGNQFCPVQKWGRSLHPVSSCSVSFACIRGSSADGDQILSRDSRDRKCLKCGPNAALKGSSGAISEHSSGDKEADRSSK